MISPRDMSRLWQSGIASPLAGWPDGAGYLADALALRSSKHVADRGAQAHGRHGLAQHEQLAALG